MLKNGEMTMIKADRIFKIGDCVKVKKGVLDPDNDAYCIENWQGEIIEVYGIDHDQPLYLIQWDENTCSQIPDSFIEESHLEELDWQKMNLYSDDIEHVKEASVGVNL
jgi:hypothetical protein